LEAEEAAYLEEVRVVVELMQEVGNLETVSVVHMEAAVV
jgi:Ca2+-dependent lipid-binding protein